MIKLQHDTLPVASDAVEIDKVVLDLQTRLTGSLTWLTHGYGKAYKLPDLTNGYTLYIPAVFMGNENYLPVVPDTDKQGQSIFLVSEERIEDFGMGFKSYLSYDVSILFSCNLKLVNSTLLGTDYFQQNLIQEVRRVLASIRGVFYTFEITDIESEASQIRTGSLT